MTGESAPLEGTAAADPICPYLGMVGDRHGRHSFPSRLHLCHAGQPAHIGLGFQADFCLGGQYPSCARYQRAEEAAAVEAAANGVVTASLAADGAIATAALAPMPAASSSRLGRVRDPDGRRTSPLVTALLGLALITTLGALAIAFGLIKLPSGGPIAVVTPTPTIAVSQTPVITDTPTPVASPTPTPSPQPTATPSAATGEILHTVQPGETLSSIADFYNVPIEAIVARNGITDPNNIQAGQVLVIPVGGTSPSPTATNTPTPSQATVTPKPTKTPAATSFIYVVQSGDTLSGIADTFNVTIQQILDANPDITDPDKIFVGQQIVIPAAP